MKYFEYQAAYFPYQNNWFQKADAAGFRWTEMSVGPYRQHYDTNGMRVVIDMPAHIVSLYDPTNGTVSAGYIIRSNKGILP